MTTLTKQRKREKADYKLEDLWNFFKSLYPIKTRFYQVDKDIFKKVCKEYNEALISGIMIDEGKVIDLPYNLGSMYIQKKKMSFASMKKLKMDYQKSKELGKRVYHMNDHTRNHSYSFHWMKKRSRVKGRERYIFSPVRTHKRYLASVLKNEDREIDYFELIK